MPCPACRSPTFHGTMNSKQQTALAKTWYEDTLRACFPDADEAFRLNTGFTNPIGQTFQHAMEAILTGLVTNAAVSEFRAPLDRIVHVLAVQGLPAGFSVRFLFILRIQLAAFQDISAEDKLRWFERIDTMAEMAVEHWAQCRETIFNLRIKELRKRIQQLEGGIA